MRGLFRQEPLGNGRGFGVPQHDVPSQAAVLKLRPTTYSEVAQSLLSGHEVVAMNDFVVGR